MSHLKLTTLFVVAFSFTSTAGFAHFPEADHRFTRYLEWDDQLSFDQRCSGADNSVETSFLRTRHRNRDPKSHANALSRNREHHLLNAAALKALSRPMSITASSSDKARITAPRLIESNRAQLAGPVKRHKAIGSDPETLAPPKCNQQQDSTYFASAQPEETNSSSTSPKQTNILGAQASNHITGQSQYRQLAAAEPSSIEQKHSSGASGETLNSLEARVEAAFSNADFIAFEKLIVQLISLRTSLLGRYHHDTVGVIRLRAYHLAIIGRSSEAEILITHILDGLIETLGNDHLETIEVRRHLAELYAATKDDDVAETMFGEILAKREALLGPEHLLVAESLADLGHIYTRSSRYSLAENYLRRALNIHTSQSSQNALVVSQIKSTLASALIGLGRNKDAEPLLVDSLNFFEERFGSRHPTYGIAASALTQLYSSEGRLLEAEALANKALSAIASAFGSKTALTATISNDLGEVYRKAGRNEEAAEIHRSAVTIRQKEFGPDASPTLESQNNLALTYQALGRHKDAEAINRQVLAARKGMANRSEIVVALSMNNLAINLDNQQQYDEAETLHFSATAIRLKELGENHPLLAQSYANLGWHFSLKEDWRNARLYYSKSTRILVARLRGEIQGPRDMRDHQHELFSDRYGLFAHVRAAFMLIETGARDASVMNEAFVASQWEVYSGASFAVTQLVSRFSIVDPRLASIVREIQDLLVEQDALEDAIIKTTAGLPSQGPGVYYKVTAEHRRRIDEIRDKLTALNNELDATFPKYSNTVVPKTIDIAAVQSRLADDEILVNYSVGELETFIWAISKRSATLHRTESGRASYLAMTESLRCGLNVDVWSVSQMVDSCKRLLSITTEIDSRREFRYDLTTAHLLYQALLQPIEAEIAGKRLLMVTPGVLSSVPFHLLLTKPSSVRFVDKDEEYRRQSWLGLQQAIRILPSVSSVGLRSHRLEPIGGDFSYLGVGAPHLDGTSVRFGAAVGAGLKVLTSLFRGNGLADVKALKLLEPLPDSEQELNGIARIIGRSRSRVMIGDDATEGSLKSLSRSLVLEKYRILHFATHGLNGGGGGLSEPALVLTPPNEATREDDGLLTASEASTLRLNADLVILSACSTADIGALISPRLNGLVQAFLYAGARAVWASRWPIRSSSAVALTTRSFSEIDRNRKIGLEEALRLSMQYVFNKMNPHPSYWGAFILVGP